MALASDKAAMAEGAAVSETKTAVATSNVTVAAPKAAVLCAGWHPQDEEEKQTRKMKMLLRTAPRPRTPFQFLLLRSARIVPLLAELCGSQPWAQSGRWRRWRHEGQRRSASAAPWA